VASKHVGMEADCTGADWLVVVGRYSSTDAAPPSVRTTMTLVVDIGNVKPMPDLVAVIDGDGVCDGVVEDDSDVDTVEEGVCDGDDVELEVEVPVVLGLGVAVREDDPEPVCDDVPLDEGVPVAEGDPVSDFDGVLEADKPTEMLADADDDVVAVDEGVREGDEVVVDEAVAETVAVVVAVAVEELVEVEVGDEVCDGELVEVLVRAGVDVCVAVCEGSAIGTLKTPWKADPEATVASSV